MLTKRWNLTQTANEPVYVKAPLPRSEGGSLEECAEALFDSLGQIIPYDRIGIALISSNREFTELRWLKSKASAEALKHGFSAPLKGSSLEQILIHNKARIIDDLEEYLRGHPDSESTRLAIKDGIRSSLTCPLRSGQGAIGFIFFSSFAPRTYSAAHLQIYSLIASTVANTLEKASVSEAFATLKAREVFFRKILHDLRNPLTVMKALLDSASGPLVCAAPIMKQSDAMFALLNDLQNALEIGSSEFAVQKQLVDFDDFLSVTAIAAESLCRSKNIEFVFKRSTHLPRQVYFDPQRITQTIGNLLSNAIKFSLARTSVVLEVSLNADTLHFSLQDKGCGISRLEVPHLFEVSSRKTKANPTQFEHCQGFGLSIVKQIVEDHGGRVWAESILGCGSTFHFELPYKSPN